MKTTFCLNYNMPTANDHDTIERQSHINTVTVTVTLSLAHGANFIR